MRSTRKNRATVSSTAGAQSSEALENVPDVASPCCASNEGCCFKENIYINMNKSETLKLALEPQQMKRKKKGGGYNLRKSLAWDRAFFTEEGVLDPLELSVLSGASYREGLPFINEDTDTLSGSQPSPKAGSLQKLENNPLKELEDEDLGKDGKKDWSSVKPDSSSSITLTSLALHKVSTRIASKSGSRCGDCSRPAHLSSLKRPANVNVGKAAGKELKLPKVPSLKPGLSSSVETTKRNIPRANHMKQYQVTQSGLHSSSKSLKTAQNAPKASSLQSAWYSDGNSDSSFRRWSSINKSPALVDKADSSGPRMTSDSMTPARPVHSSEAQREPTTSPAPFSQKAQVSGRTMHRLQNQTIKPSGLRMPSPSLSFFSQPKSSVLRDLPLRGKETDVCGFQKPQNLSLQDNLRRATKADISSNALSSTSEYMAPPHVGALDLIKSNLKRNSFQNVAMKFQDLSKNNITERMSNKGAELQRGDIEVPPRGSHKQAGDGFYKKFIDNYPVKSESCGREGRHPEVRSERNHAIYESEKISVTDIPHKEKNTCNLLFLSNGVINGTQFEDAVDHGVQSSLEMQSDWEETCKPDLHEYNKEQTDPFSCSHGDTDEATEEDKNLLKTIERASKQLGVAQQNGRRCTGNASIEALEHERAKAENPYFGSKNPHADLLKEAASIEVLTGNSQAGDSHMQNFLCSSIGGSNNSINLLSEVDDDTRQSGKDSEVAYDNKQTGKCSEVPDICTKIGIDLHRNAGLNTSESFLPEKQTCLRKSQQEKDVEELLREVPERKDGNEVIETKMANPLPLGKMNDCSSGKMIGPLISAELGPIDNFLSSESQNDLISTTSNCDGKHQGNDSFHTSLSETVMLSGATVGKAPDDSDFRSNELENVLLNSSEDGKSLNTLHQDTQSQRTEIDCYSSFHESRTSEVCPNNIPGKMTEVGLITRDGFAKNWFLSTMSLKESVSDMDNLGNVRDSRTGLVQSPESNLLNGCCFKQSEHLALGNAEFVAENLAHGNAGLHFENCLQTKGLAAESCEDKALGCMEDSAAGQNEILLRSLENPRDSAQESPFKHEICNDECPSGGRSPVMDTIADSSGFKLTEVRKDTNNSFSCLPSESDLKAQAALAPNNINGDGVNEKICSSVLPPNAIPFSDEWLAAIEAAGEDILTRKSGAVQNSPPDKSLPEPSPWSPVKKKNNPIGPFDCTKKFTNVPSSDLK